MSEPRVLCILPYHMTLYVERARECFRSQTYQNRFLHELNTFGKLWAGTQSKMPVGGIRNWLIAATIDLPKFDLIAHFDHDDWSAPGRLTEQVAFLEETGAEVVGYSDMPFMDEIKDQVKFFRFTGKHQCFGTSLLYRRETWERVKFPDRQIGEDNQWLDAVGRSKAEACSSLVNGSPRMIATIHKANTSPKRGRRFEPASPEIAAEVRRLLGK